MFSASFFFVEFLQGAKLQASVSIDCGLLGNSSWALKVSASNSHSAHLKRLQVVD